jgi:hypothetical protein
VAGSTGALITSVRDYVALWIRRVFLREGLVVGECKWSANVVGLEVLVDLERKAQVLGAFGRWPKVSYVLFAKVGFMSHLEALAASEGIRLVQGADLLEEQSAS